MHTESVDIEISPTWKYLSNKSWTLFNFKPSGSLNKETCAKLFFFFFKGPFSDRQNVRLLLLGTAWTYRQLAKQRWAHCLGERRVAAGSWRACERLLLRLLSHDRLHAPHQTSATVQHRKKKQTENRNKTRGCFCNSPTLSESSWDNSQLTPHLSSSPRCPAGNGQNAWHDGPQMKARTTGLLLWILMRLQLMVRLLKPATKSPLLTVSLPGHSK